VLVYEESDQGIGNKRESSESVLHGWLLVSLSRLHVF